MTGYRRAGAAKRPPWYPFHPGHTHVRLCRAQRSKRAERPEARLTTTPKHHDREGIRRRIPPRGQTPLKKGRGEPRGENRFLGSSLVSHTVPSTTAQKGSHEG